MDHDSFREFFADRLAVRYINPCFYEDDNHYPSAALISRRFQRAHIASTPADLIELLNEHRSIDLVVLCTSNPPGSLVQFLRDRRRENPNLLVIHITANAGADLTTGQITTNESYCEISAEHDVGTLRISARESILASIAHEFLSGAA